MRLYEQAAFLAGLKSLERAGLVSVDVLGDHQVALLTPRGEALRVG